MTELRNGEEILLEVPGVLYTSIEGEEAVAFSRITTFGGIATVHGRGGNLLLRADRTSTDDTTGDLYIESRGKRYSTREFTDEDGLWLSRYMIDLPEDALAGLTAQGNAENMDTPETLTGYIDGGFLVGLVYENNQGTWLREDNQWLTIDPEDDEMVGDEVTVFEADPEQAAALIELFDTQYATAEEALAFGIEGA